MIATQAATDAALLSAIRRSCHPLASTADLGPLLERIARKRFVLLGEASHGTAEFYRWRAAITRRLIEEHGFTTVAVEGDWPDCYEIHRFVSGYEGAATDARGALEAFGRWPSWMWANEEVLAFISWLQRWNLGAPAGERVGFYGLDVYSLWDSLRVAVRYVERYDPSSAAIARAAYRCFEPYRDEPHAYARAIAFISERCEEQVVRLLTTFRRSPPIPDDPEERFNAEQNALVAVNAERYYRAMIRGDTSWNVRDRHMWETTERLAARAGGSAKVIVWAHNTHVGDARATDMAAAGMLNLGQLAREAYGRDAVAIVGFTTYAGEVIAAQAWDAPAERMPVPPAQAGSWDALLHEGCGADALVLLGPDLAGTWRGQRAIGVVYDPERERRGNYVPTDLAARYDAVCHIGRTGALSPIPVPERIDPDLPETFPSAA